MKTTPAMVVMLRTLACQMAASSEYPGAYSPHLTPGTMGCHLATSKALIARKLVDEIQHPTFGRCIQINAAGRAAIVAASN